MPNDHEKELLRAARVARFRRRPWKEFWAAHDDEIRTTFPDARERMDLIHRLQTAILCGTSGERVEEIRS